MQFTDPFDSAFWTQIYKRDDIVREVFESVVSLGDIVRLSPESDVYSWVNEDWNGNDVACFYGWSNNSSCATIQPLGHIPSQEIHIAHLQYSVNGQWINVSDLFPEWKQL